MVDDNPLPYSDPGVDSLSGVETLTDLQLRSLGSIINAQKSGTHFAAPLEDIEVLTAAGLIEDIDGQYRVTEAGNIYYQNNTR